MPATKIVGFNYRALQGETGDTVRRSAQTIRLLVQRTASNVIEIGRRLIEVRPMLGLGQWGAWLRCEFAWSNAYALQLMKVAERFGESHEADRFQLSALILLSHRNVPEKAVAEAIRTARAGQVVTHTRASEIIRKHRPEPVPQADQTLLWNLKRHIERLAGNLGCNFMAEHLQTIVNELRERGAESGPMIPRSNGKPAAASPSSL